MKDKKYYEKLFEEYPQEVTLNQFRKMLNGLSENTARKLIKDGKIQAELKDYPISYKRDSLTITKILIDKQDTINYIVQKKFNEFISNEGNQEKFKNQNEKILEIIKNEYTNHFKKLPEELTLMQFRKMLGNKSIKTARKILATKAIKFSKKQVVKKMDKESTGISTCYIISKESIIDYVSSDDYQNTRNRRKANI